MSFIPSFILSTLIFCNAKVPGGWDEAVFTEGIFFELPYVSFTASYEGNADEIPALKNAAVIIESDALSLKLAAGSLAVSGTGDAATLSIALPAKDDGKKPLSYFISWKGFSSYYTDSRMIIGLCAGRSDTMFQNALTAGWTRIEPTKDDSWYLRYPWHTGGNLHSLQDTLTARFSFWHLRLETAGTASLSLPDMLPPAAAGALDLLLKAGHAETTLAFASTPAHFMTGAGTLTNELLSMKATFAYTDTGPLKASPPLSESKGSDKDSGSFEARTADKAEVVFKATAGFVVKQPAAAHELSKNFISASMSHSLKAGPAAAGVALEADRFCLEDKCREGELTPAAELTLYNTACSIKGKVLPFQDRTSENAVPPEFTIKAAHSYETMSFSYTATFSNAILQTQTFSLTDSRESISLNTEITIRQEGISWNLSFSKAW